MPMEIGENDDSVEMLRKIHISSYNDERDDDADPEEVEDLMNDDDDDNDDDEVQNPVTLGFVEKPKNKWSLLRQLFPSKAGGVPAWLDPNDLPSGRSRLCDICGEPLQFLLQVYAPTSDRESTFHRTLYLFTCPSMSCLLRDQHEQWKRPAVDASRSVKVFRCQLPHENPFYSSEPPRHDGSDKPLGSGAPLCNWCGTWKGDKTCGSCREARYCSEEHQALHWCSGHKVTCQSSSSRNAGNSSGEEQKPASRSLWPEYEIGNEDESEYDVDVSADENNTSCLVSRNQMDDSVNSLMDLFQGDSDKKSWGNFQERIARAPEQVLRYCRNVCSGPLWPMSSGQPSRADIPNCSYCGKPRCFEFQVLPQLLYFFGVKNDADSLDWATIVVYSCEASCDGKAAYKEEFAWVQVSSSSQMTYGIHKLPKWVVYLLVPGLFSNHGSMYVVNTKMSFSKMGLACHIAKIHSQASVEKNAREIKEYIEEKYWGAKKRVLILGHSKGGIDPAAALSLYWPELKDKVAGLAIAQSPYSGTPVASDVLREGQLGDYVSLRKLIEILICEVIKVVRPQRKMDHDAWMVYSTLSDNSSEADASKMCEALLTLLVEVRENKRRELEAEDE